MKVYIGNYPEYRWYHKLMRTEPCKIEFVQVDNHDVWSADTTLAIIIAPTLQKLRDYPGGASAFVDINDRPGHLVGHIPEKGAVDQYHHEAWDWALDEMIYAFESSKNQFKGEDEEDYLENDIRIENGFRLFGKYYRHLWH